jgi:carbon storage regulator
MGKLVLGRKCGESLIIGDALVTVERMSGNRVTLSIDAPQSCKVLRSEIEPHKAPTNPAPLAAYVPQT